MDPICSQQRVLLPATIINLRTAIALGITVPLARPRRRGDRICGHVC